MEMVSVPCSETNDNHIVEQGLLRERTNKAEYFQEACGKFEMKMQGFVKVYG